MRKPDNIPLLCIFGPTAVGKTALIGRLNSDIVEIINVDSMQVYRYMDIGTAKPPPSLLRRIPHHLIDILDPDRQFNTGMFVRHCGKLVSEIRQRGKLPVLSGGTAFYFKNFLFGMPPTPKSDEAIRKAVAEELDRFGIEELYRQLEAADPETAGRLSPKDRYRVCRALEVYRQTGRPLSAFPKEEGPRRDIDFLLIGLQRPREELYRRIDCRVEQMMAEGLPGEVAGLMARGYTCSDPGMKAIGYREFFFMRRQGCRTLKSISGEIAKASRNYAKRQITFFSGLPDVNWFHPDSVDEIADFANLWLRGKGFDNSSILV